MKKWVSIGLWLTLLLLLWIIIGDLLSITQPSGVYTTIFIVAIMTLVLSILEQGLFRYFISRLISSVILLLVIATLTFVMLRLLPGGPFDEEKALPSIVKKNIEKKYGLHLPLYEQYWVYLKGLSQGELGYSYKYEGKSVKEILKDALPVSIKLGFYSLLLAYLLGVPLGLFAAAKAGTTWDTSAMIFAISGLSVPSFLLAPLLIAIFSFGWPLNILTPQLHQWLLQEDWLLPAALWHSPKHFVLPVITLGIRPAAFIARLTRASVLDVIAMDFVRTAHAKGLDRTSVLYRHVLRNSLVPVLTYSGPLVAGLLSGSFVVEIVFAIPGIAKYFVQSVFNRDYPLILALTLLFSFLLIIANLLVDILYKVVDPRIEVT